MTKINEKQKRVIARQIRKYKELKYPGKGSGNRLASALSVSPQVLSQWLNGKRTPSPLQLNAMAKLFNITIQELAGNEKIRKIKSKNPVTEVIADITNFQISAQNPPENRKKSIKSMRRIKQLIINELCDLL